jgi:hypothetical protein
MHFVYSNVAFTPNAVCGFYSGSTLNRQYDEINACEIKTARKRKPHLNAPRLKPILFAGGGRLSKKFN